MGHNIAIVILEEKLRALNALVMYEVQPEKRDIYKQDLTLVASKLNDARRAAKTLAFRASV